MTSSRYSSRHYTHVPRIPIRWGEAGRDGTGRGRGGTENVSDEERRGT